MAQGSWMGIYISVSDDLMAQRREQELLLFMAIARHADRLGFCFPGRARLMAMRRISQPVYERRLAFLEEQGIVKMTESWDYRRRQPQFDFQVSPRAMYVREEFQGYCEQVFDGVQERDFARENWLLENHFSTNDSQPESEPETEPESESNPIKPNATTRNSNQRGRAETQKGQRRTPTTTGNAPLTPEQPKATNATAHRKDNPQAGGPNPDDFDKLLSPTVDDDQLADEIRFAIATTSHQARDIVATYQRDHIVHWLKHAAVRRAKGELSNPGGYFYRMVKKHALLIDESELP